MEKLHGTPQRPRVSHQGTALASPGLCGKRCSFFCSNSHRKCYRGEQSVSISSLVGWHWEDKTVLQFSILSWVSFRRATWTLWSQVHRVPQLEGVQGPEGKKFPPVLLWKMSETFPLLWAALYSGNSRQWGTRKGWGVKKGRVMIRFIYTETVKKCGSTWQ